MSIEVLKEVLQKLNKQEQAELMHFMVELLATDTTDLSDAWKKELDKREAALNNGTSVGQVARDVLNKYTPKSE